MGRGTLKKKTFGGSGRPRPTLRSIIPAFCSSSPVTPGGVILQWRWAAASNMFFLESEEKKKREREKEQGKGEKKSFFFTRIGRGLCLITKASKQ